MSSILHGHRGHHHGSHGESQKASGWAFSVNLARSLGLWGGDGGGAAAGAGAGWPSDVQKPQYIALSATGNGIDWQEQLRKYCKHNPGTEGQLVAATVRLEIVVWIALAAQQQGQGGSSSTSSSSATMTQSTASLKKVARERRERRAALATVAAADSSMTAAPLPERPDDLRLRGAKRRRAVQDALEDVQKQLSAMAAATATASSLASQDAQIVSALAHYALGQTGDAERCLASVGTPSSSSASGLGAAAASSSNDVSHSLDLHVLSIVLRGLSLEQRAHASPKSTSTSIQEALQVYARVPVSPPPATPEAQRYTEVALYRIAMLQRPVNGLSAHRTYFGLTSHWGGISPTRRERMYWTYLYSLLFQQPQRSFLQHPPSSSSSNNNNNNNSTNVEESSAEYDLDHIQHTFSSYDRLLHSTPSLSAFPRAGEPTYPMTDFMDLVYAYWARGLLTGTIDGSIPSSAFAPSPSSASGAAVAQAQRAEGGGQWAVAALTRCLSATYASQKLLRYLTTILACLSFAAPERSAGKRYAQDALRNLRLYIALFEKSNETDQIAVQREIRSFRERTEGVEADSLASNEVGAGAAPTDNVNGTNGANHDNVKDVQLGAEDIESDEHFCTVCCVGARLLLRECSFNETEELADTRIELAQEAMGTMVKAHERLHQHSHQQQQQSSQQGPTQQQPSQQGAKQQQGSSGKPYLSSPGGAGEATVGREAQNDLSGSGSRRQKAVQAEVDLWLGIAKAEFALAEADPDSGRERAKRGLALLGSASSALSALASSHSHSHSNSHSGTLSTTATSLSRQVVTLETVDPLATQVALAPSLRTRALYSLAYAQLEMRDVDSALSTAKKAVASLAHNYPATASASQQEVDTDAEGGGPQPGQQENDLRVWHLFVLALSSKKDWARAKEVAELALDAYSSECHVYGDEDGTIVEQRADADARTFDAARETGGGSSGDVGGGEQQSAVPVTRSPTTLDGFPPPLRNTRTQLVTRADAPYDPASIGSSNKQAASAAANPSMTDASSSSFVNVKMPHSADQRSSSISSFSSALQDPGNAFNSSSAGVAANAAAAATSASKSDEQRKIRLVSVWDDLECETELWITRNRCIEAVQGPEIALHDLQTNVFVRFSKRRDAIQATLRLHEAAADMQRRQSIQSSAAGFPYTSREMTQRDPLAGNTAGAALELPKVSRPRSILGSIKRHRSRTADAAVEKPTSNLLGVPQANERPASIASGRSGRSTTPSRATHTSTLPATSGRNSLETPHSALPGSSNHVGNQQQQQPQQPRHHVRAQALLAKLWLVSAASFRRWGKLDECKGAINEAEDAAGETNPDVWVQYALYLEALNHRQAASNAKPSGVSKGAAQDERAIMAVMKATSISTDHVATVLTLAKFHYELGNPAIAEGFLDIATQTNAWDSPEAWYLLAKVYEQTRREKRARECLQYALGLEETRPIRELRHVLQRYL